MAPIEETEGASIDARTSVALVDSLLQAIIRADGDALVMHVGEKPFVTGAGVHTELSSVALKPDALAKLLEQLLPPDCRKSLEDHGAIEYNLPPNAALVGEQFTIVAAQNGGDIWVEIRRARRGEAGAELVAGVDRAAEMADVILTGAAATRPAAQAIGVAAAELQGVEPVAAAPNAVEEAFHADLASVSFAAETTRLPGGSPGGEAGRLLRLAVARGALTLCVFPGMPPVIRLDGEMTPLPDEPPLAALDVEAILWEASPGGAGDMPASGEWMMEIRDVGRVHCLSFHDRRGLGGVFRVMPQTAASADQLGLPRPVQALAAEPDGLVLIAGPRDSGKSMLLFALVDLVNRTRRAHVITIEPMVTGVHENRLAVVSQRETGREADVMQAGVRAAIAEQPDVLAIDEPASGPIVQAATAAALSGCLVIAAVNAPGAEAALRSVLEAWPSDRRGDGQSRVGRALRGVVSQVLIQKNGGGRVAAREVLLNTPEVAAMIAGGQLGTLSAAIEQGRKLGMAPRNDALVALVKSKMVDIREAWRRASDRQGLLEQLKKDGVDVSFAETP